MVQSSMPYGRVDAIAASNAKQPPHNVTLSRRATFGTERAFAERAMTPRDASRRAQSCPRASLAWNVPTRFTRAFGASRHHAQKLSWKASLHVRYGGANARDVLSRPPSPRGVDRVSIELVSGNRRARSSRPRRTHLDSNAGSSASRHPRLTAAERRSSAPPRLCVTCKSTSTGRLSRLGPAATSWSALRARRRRAALGIRTPSRP
jgi:hypothetical protein